MKIMKYLKTTLNAEWGKFIGEFTFEKQGLCTVSRNAFMSFLRTISKPRHMDRWWHSALRHLTILSPALKASCPMLSTVTPDYVYRKLNDFFSDTFVSEIFN